MAAPSTQQLEQFIKTLDEDLTNDRLRPTEALAIVQQTPYLLGRLKIELGTLSPDVLSSKQLLKENLHVFLDKIIKQTEIIYNNPEELIVQTPSQIEVSARANSIEEASRVAKEMIKRRNRRFIQSLVKKFSLSPQTEQALIESLERLPTSASDHEASKAVIKTLAATSEGAQIPRQELVVTQNDLARNIHSSRQSSRIITETIVTDDSRQTDVLVKLADNKLDKFDAPTDKQIYAAFEESRLTTRAYEAMAVSQVPSPGTLQGADFHYFQALGTNDVQRSLGKIADSALGILGPNAQRQVVEASLSKSFHRVTADTQKLSEELGPELFQQLKEQGQLEFGTRPKGVGLLVNIFTNPVAERLLGNSDSIIKDTIELNRLNLFSPESIKHLKLAPSTPPGPGMVQGSLAKSVSTHAETAISGIQTFFVYHQPDLHFALLYRTMPHLMHFEFLNDIAGWILRWGAKKTATEGAKAVASGAVQTGAKGIFSKLLAPILGTVVGGPAGTVAGFLGGEAVTRVGGKILGGLLGGAKGLLTGSFITDFGKPKKWYQVSIWDFAGIIAVIAVLAVMFLGMFTTSTVQTAIVTSAPGGRGSGIAGESKILPFACNTKPDPSAIEQCPVANGTVTQGPNMSPSHQGADAYDIAAAMGTPVLAAHSGWVYDYHCCDAPGTGTGFGNFVRLVGTRGDGTTFVTTYAHLKDVTRAIQSAEKAKNAQCLAPTLIEKGKQIGIMDATGYVIAGSGGDGTHLHFQYNGPGALSLPCTLSRSY